MYSTSLDGFGFALVAVLLFLPVVYLVVFTIAKLYQRPPGVEESLHGPARTPPEIGGEQPPVGGTTPAMPNSTAEPQPPAPRIRGDGGKAA